MNHIDYKEIGIRIKARRKALGLTQQKAEELAGLSPKYMSNLELGRSIPSLETLMKLCRVLDCTPDNLLLGTDKTSLSDFSRLIEMKTNTFSISEKEWLLKFIDFLKKNKF